MTSRHQYFFIMNLSNPLYSGLVAAKSIDELITTWIIFAYAESPANQFHCMTSGSGCPSLYPSSSSDQNCTQYFECGCSTDSYKGFILPAALFSIPFLNNPYNGIRFKNKQNNIQYYKLLYNTLWITTELYWVISILMVLQKQKQN